MADRLKAQPAMGLVHRLGHHGAVRPAGVAVHERADLALATVLARRDAGPALPRKISELFGLALPDTPTCAVAGGVSFVWAGPGHWLAIAEHEHGHRFEARLRQSLEGLASVTDQSDARAVLRLSGPRARDTLAKGLPVDLDPRVMRPDAAIVSTIAHIGVMLWQVDTAPTYDLAVPRSYALSFWHWLQASAAEFGLTVAPE